jgi:hypothetical protein
VAEAAGFYSWPNLRFLPISDGPTVSWAFVWRTANTTPLIQAFAQVAAAGPERTPTPPVGHT